jgi:hypothetical protein
MPALVPIPFANAAGSGYIRTVPVPSQIGVTAGAASFTDGFTPDTFTPLSGGGAYVSGEDINGILNHVTKWTRWLSAGGPAIYNSVLATGMGGYPKGAVVAGAALDGTLWFNEVDGNLTNPDGTSPVGWARVVPKAATDAQALAGIDTSTFITPETLAYVLANKFQLTDADQTFQVGPLIFKFGTNRTFHPGEGGVLTTFTTPFPTACLVALPVGYIETPGDTGNDMWTKVSTRTRTGFYTNYGAASSGNDGHGFDWIAVGL